MAPRYPVDWRDSVLWATSYPVDWRESVLSGHRYPVDWRDSVLSAYQVPWGLAGLSPFSPPGTLRTGATQSLRPTGNLATGRHGRTCLSRYTCNIYIVCIIPWRPSTGGLVRVKREKRGLVHARNCIYLSFLFAKIKRNVLNIIRMSSMLQL